MIVNNPHIECIAAAPSKHQSPLIVDPYRVKSLQVAFQILEPVPGGRSEVPQISGVMEIEQLSPCDPAQISREQPRCFAFSVLEKILSESVPERFDHIPMLSECDNTFKSAGDLVTVTFFRGTRAKRQSSKVIVQQLS